MRAEWKKIYPNNTLDEQRICSQLNSIRRRNVLISAELELIKQQVSMEMRGNVTQQTEAQVEELETDHSEGEPKVEVQQATPGHDEDAFVSYLKENY
ncbi:hypothetical protein R5R35_012765 [Gryllus longicercus]|uniref:Uncharacterized protein n=1 Tax=Gryllus longicercus TaxID=2509291 RepID=A0AAN9VJV1_9ORTH